MAATPARPGQRREKPVAAYLVLGGGAHEERTAPAHAQGGAGGGVQEGRGPTQEAQHGGDAHDG